MTSLSVKSLHCFTVRDETCPLVPLLPQNPGIRTRTVRYTWTLRMLIPLTAFLTNMKDLHLYTLVEGDVRPGVLALSSDRTGCPSFVESVARAERCLKKKPTQGVFWFGADLLQMQCACLALISKVLLWASRKLVKHIRSPCFHLLAPFSSWIVDVSEKLTCVHYVSYYGDQTGGVRGRIS